MQPCGTSYAALCKKDIGGTTIVYHSVGKDGGTGFEFWEIPGIIIAVIVIGTIAYTMLRHFCKCLAETCESVCDCCGNMFSSCKRRIDRCYDGGCECSRCERF
uniref:Uncharacterized protein LOC102806561 n=1 Tax=Saccoglossus kowalevskii TaxID=10224 RepID=A0ABM0MN76_SACKO|nr:PREDICTED: uncharacterized protein LOC102806561 [Saccoglossus kowalevskii]